ncbi:uncharacterized protein [Narcine bancroftii]|uniref:uncharacterized protein n=1 Tax=Narcine bancroftii TaxID=1343680 RepID=UPI003831AF52
MLGGFPCPRERRFPGWFLGSRSREARAPRPLPGRNTVSSLLEERGASPGVLLQRHCQPPSHSLPQGPRRSSLHCNSCPDRADLPGDAPEDRNPEPGLSVTPSPADPQFRPPRETLPRRSSAGPRFVPGAPRLVESGLETSVGEYVTKLHHPGPAPGGPDGSGKPGPWTDTRWGQVIPRISIPARTLTPTGPFRPEPPPPLDHSGLDPHPHWTIPARTPTPTGPFRPGPPPPLDHSGPDPHPHWTIPARTPTPTGPFRTGPPPPLGHSGPDHSPPPGPAQPSW